MRCSKDVRTGLWMMPLTRRIVEPTYNRQNFSSIGGDSPISGVASTNSQSATKGALDVLELNFHAAHPETDGMPYLRPNNYLDAKTVDRI